MSTDTYDKDLREDLVAIIRELVEGQPALEPGTVLVRQGEAPAASVLFKNARRSGK